MRRETLDELERALEGARSDYDDCHRFPTQYGDRILDLIAAARENAELRRERDEARAELRRLRDAMALVTAQQCARHGHTRVAGGPNDGVCLCCGGRP